MLCWGCVSRNFRFPTTYTTTWPMGVLPCYKCEDPTYCLAKPQRNLVFPQPIQSKSEDTQHNTLTSHQLYLVPEGCEKNNLYHQNLYLSAMSIDTAIQILFIDALPSTTCVRSKFLLTTVDSPAGFSYEVRTEKKLLPKYSSVPHSPPWPISIGSSVDEG